MIQFIIKGILSDRSRSLLPVIIISIGVFLTIALSGYIRGAFGDMIDQNAKFETGHVKIMTRAYADNKDQMPNDLALLEIGALHKTLQKDFPEMEWVDRIKFGGLIDVPDAQGNTRAQGPSAGIALNLISTNSSEVQRLNIENSLVSGRIPNKASEAILGHAFSENLKIELGDEFTYFGTTMEGSMTFKSFVVVGTIRFGATAMDKGALLIDISDAQEMLDMEDGTGEILGFSNKGIYVDDEAIAISEKFNATYKTSVDEYAPVMFPLKAQNNLAGIIDYGEAMSGIFIFTFIIAMSIVLWNTGLLGGLRRYKEFGIRLALGESKGQIYRTMIIEAAIVGIIGSVLGTILGLMFSYYMQVVGWDISSYMQNATMIMPNIIRSKVTSDLFYIGFIPGVFAMVLGTMLAGIGIYKRETASLFKELEV